MKNFYLIAIIFCCDININAQAPNWEWAKNAGGNYGQAIATGKGGFVWVTGRGSSDSIYNGQNIEYEDVFTSKFDSSGNLIWIESAPGGEGTAIAVDIYGNSYVAGVGDLTNADGFGFAFLIKYDQLGNLLWQKNIGGNAYSLNTIVEVGVDANSNAYITVSFYDSTITIGNIILHDSIGNVGSYNVFIAKYDQSGNVIWAKSTEGVGSGYWIRTDADGNSFLTGEFAGPVITFGTYTLQGQGLFLVKYDSSGNVLWAKDMEENVSGNAIAIDGSGNIFVTGSGFLANTDTIGDNFIIKYDTSGNMLWARDFGCLYSYPYYGSSVSGVSVDKDDNTYVTGIFYNPTASFGNITLVNQSGNTAYEDIFIVKYDALGNVVWAITTGGYSGPYGFSTTGISSDYNDNIYITGYNGVTGLYGFQGIIFGNDTLSEYGVGGDLSFVAKLGGTTTGITNTTLSENPIHVFPNPSTSTFNLTGLTTGATVQIYNLLGEIIYTGTANDNNYRLSLNTQAKGIYFYKVNEDGTAVGQGKIVLE